VLCPAHMACPSRSVFSWEHHGRGPTKTIAARRAFLFMRLCCGQSRGIEPPLGHAMNNTSNNCVGKGLFFRQFLRLIKMQKWLMVRLKMYVALWLVTSFPRSISCCMRDPLAKIVWVIVQNDQ
jgi:hypothetical protein